MEQMRLSKILPKMEGADAIAVSGVRFYVKDKKIVLTLKGSQLRPNTEELEGVIEKMFRGARVMVELQETEDSPPREPEERRDERAWIEWVEEYLIGTAPFLKGSGMELAEKEGKLHIRFASEIHREKVEQIGGAAEIQERIAERWGRDVIVELEVREEFDSENFIDYTKRREAKLVNALREQAATAAAEEKSKKEAPAFRIGKAIVESPVPIGSVTQEFSDYVVTGKVFAIETKKIVPKKDTEDSKKRFQKTSTNVLSFDLDDGEAAILCTKFVNDKILAEFKENVTEEATVVVAGTLDYDFFRRCKVLKIKRMGMAKADSSIDAAEEKRTELNLHTQMSAMDGFISPKNLIDRLKSWGHTAVAVTDRGSVQGYPEMYDAAKGSGIKVLYGLEGKLLDDSLRIATNFPEGFSGEEYVAFDIETTGLSKSFEKITEIGAVKIVGDSVVDVFQTLVNPEKPISEEITKLTGITDAMVADEETIDVVLPKFLEFVGDCPLVAHNADFDIGFIRFQAQTLGISYDPAYLDTLSFSRALLPELKNHRLNTVARELGVRLFNHHRASDDAKACGDVFLKLKERVEEIGVAIGPELNSMETDWNIARNFGSNFCILVQNMEGLKNLYRIVSESNLRYFYREPGIPKSLLAAHRRGLLVGSGSGEGELFQALLDGASPEEAESIAENYDYLQIEPVDVNTQLLRRQLVESEEDLRRINRSIYELGRRLGKPVVATGNVKYMDVGDFHYRNIVLHGQGRRQGETIPAYYLRTTDEMLEEFQYLGTKEAEEVVIQNPRRIVDMIDDDVQPIPSGTFPPKIAGSDEKLREVTYERARAIYSDTLPPIVKKRLDRELNSIIANGYAVLYMIARDLVLKSNEDGYLVGSRGSVGSSFAATMAGITEVNPLPPHYVCEGCRHSEFFEDGSYEAGVDMPDRDCPVCGKRMKKDGFDIPFEVFLGFDGDKEPDIDLNFAGEYQSTAHRAVEDLFGSDKVYRAGTISTIAENTAYGYINKYYEDKGVDPPQPAEKRRLFRGICGVKRTSGQHPGGVMIVPHDKDILDFTPIQYPADDASSGVITTHFSYHALSGRILKLDLLGHDVPSIIRQLQDLTGVDPLTIPLDDEKTMSLFSNAWALSYEDESYNQKIGTFGIPEFGTSFVRQMLWDTKPTTFGELVRISGLSHGTDVWLGNARDLILDGTATLMQTICTRDDIMLYLIGKGLEKKKAFNIMEKVRKGKDLSPEDETDMRVHDVPKWYIESCNKIKYMFPKAHAVAYVMMSYRIAYFKVYYPEAFYCTYFSTKLADYPYVSICEGMEAVRRHMKEIKDMGRAAPKKDQNVYSILEVAEEMLARGIRCVGIDLKKSDATKFMIVGEKEILPPLCSVPSVSESTAQCVRREAQKADFLSVQDLVERTGLNKTAIDFMKSAKILDGLPETNQINLFDLF